MKRNKLSKVSLMPIPFFFLIVVISALEEFIKDRFGFIQGETLFIVFFLLFVASFAFTVARAVMEKDRNSSTNLNATKIKNLGPNIYEHYATISNQFTFVFDVEKDTNPPVGTIGMWMNENDRYRLEHFIVVIVKHPKYLPLYRHRFETMNHTEGKYYQLSHIYALYYLLENNVTKFQVHYRLFKETIHLRTESRVLHEKLHRIQFGKDYYDIPIDLIEAMYQYYVLDQAIDDDIMKYRPKCKLDEMIYTTVLYHYLGATENDRLQNDIEGEFLKYQEVRNNL